MFPTHNGSLRLFRFSGIDVFVHWSWFVMALYLFSSRSDQYASPVWNLVEYLALFAIVLLHEFGHALACRQTGGRADLIVLWPLGGVAYVAPPQRAGAQLWSIAAGPLVNVALVPLLYGAMWVLGERGYGDSHPDLMDCLLTVNLINGFLLIFNLLPVYPLDGGQILRSVLWFFVGPVTSLLVATVLGLAGGALFLAYGVLTGRMWTMFLAAFLLFNCWQAFRQARAWRAQQAAEGRTGQADGPDGRL
jgi:Zn-dependent protease